MKNIEIGQRGCLVLDCLIDLCQPDLACGHMSIPGHGLSCLSGSTQHTLKIDVPCCRVFRQSDLVELRPLRKDGGHRRWSETASQVAHEVAQTRHRMALVPRNPDVSDRRSWNEDKAY